LKNIKYIKINEKMEVLGVSDNKLLDPKIYLEIDISIKENEDKFIKIINVLNDNKTPIIDSKFNILKKEIKYWRGLDLNKYDASEIKDIQNIEKRINKILTMDFNIYFIEYFDVLFQLANQGFFITDNNKEEKYLEILETEDDDIIDLLEKYLELKEKLTPLVFLKNTFDKKFQELEPA
jgi:hypothetical protein